MPLSISHLPIDGYEQVVEFTDDTGFQCFISLHNTKLGPGLGGTRLKSYASREDALTDVLRLSKGMTYKSSLAGLNFGGAKCVVNVPVKTRDVLLKVGEAVEYFKGQYITAEDVGTTLDDVHVFREVTQHTAQLDGSAMTARGVLAAMKAAVQWRNELEDLEDGVNLENLSIWVQGLGKVGMDLVRRLHAFSSSTNLYFSDLRKEALQDAFTFTGGREITEDDKRFINIYSPCAMGQVINADNVNTVKYAIICGSANNQLVHDEYGEILKANDVLYCPDYLVNAGGVINAAYEIGVEFDEAACEKATDAIGDKMREVFEMADAENITPLAAANKLAESRFM